MGSGNFWENIDRSNHTKQSKFTETQIVNILKEAEAGIALGELSRQHGFSKSAFYNSSRTGRLLLAELSQACGCRSVAMHNVLTVAAKLVGTGAGCRLDTNFIDFDAQVVGVAAFAVSQQDVALPDSIVNCPRAVIFAPACKALAVGVGTEDVFSEEFHFVRRENGFCILVSCGDLFIINSDAQTGWSSMQWQGGCEKAGHAKKTKIHPRRWECKQ